MTDTILDLLAGAPPERQAIVAPEFAGLTHADLLREVERLGTQLAACGIGRGDRVALALPNGPDLALLVLACACYATAAPLNPRYRQDEFAFSYGDTGAAALIVPAAGAEAARAAAAPGMLVFETGHRADGRLELAPLGPRRAPRGLDAAAPDDVALVLHTSGTTSRPKRVPLRHRNLAASARNIVSTYALGQDDTALCVMPLFHIHGIVATLLAPLAAGGGVALPPGFDALRFWGQVEALRPTWYSAVPTMHQLLLARAEPGRHAPFRFVRSSSAALPPVVMERLEAMMGAPVLESYGMTEASHQMTSNLPPPGRRAPGSVGVGVGVEVAILDAAGEMLPPGARGEVAVAGPSIFDGYEQNPDATAAAFAGRWFRTGDEGLLDTTGALTLTGRLKELINRGGEKISPLEIDDVLLRHPAVAEALTFAAPHRTLGEEVHAAVVLRQPATARELRDHCAASLADFKVPRVIHILEALPRGATGKLQRIGMACALGIEA